MNAQNRQLDVLASGARTATVDSPDFENWENRGLQLVIDVTAITATPSVVPHIQGKDALSGKYYDVLVGDAIVAMGTTVLKVYPGIAAVANVSASDIVPQSWRVRMVHGDADSITYSVAAELDV